MADVSELTQLDHPSEDSVCDVLKARLLTGEIYTGIAAMLLAVNPCEWLPGLYSPAAIQRYLGSEPNPPPHVFRTAANMHRGMSQDGRSQSVVISGESGAGPLPFFRLRRLRPLLPVVFCGIGRTADAPKGFAIPAGRRLMEQRRSWRNAVGVPRALAEAVRQQLARRGQGRCTAGPHCV